MVSNPVIDYHLPVFRAEIIRSDPAVNRATFVYYVQFTMTLPSSVFLSGGNNI